MEGLWTAEFGSSAGTFGGGVAIFRDGKILGGDGTYYYIGEYSLAGNTLRATLRYPHLSAQKACSRRWAAILRWFWRDR